MAFFSRSCIRRCLFGATAAGLCLKASICIAAAEERNQNAENSPTVIKLYQYQTCPFCSKVRVFLDYHGIPYEKVEVNPLFKKELKFATTKKVPLVVVGDVQLQESSLIISILKSQSLGSRSLSEVIGCYPEIKSKDAKGREVIEHGNKYEVMLGSTENSDARREEVKWRMWVDNKLIHALAPNIYRTWGEARRSFNYISSVGNFTVVERYGAQIVGSFAMYFIGRKLKKKYKLDEDVRQSLYSYCREWTTAVGKKRLFMGGNDPNLADLAVYGVLNAIEGMDAFNDVMVNTDIKPWYLRVQQAIRVRSSETKTPSS